jgi:hypothetical protein
MVINYYYSLRNSPEERSSHKKKVFFNLVKKLENKSFPLDPAIYFVARTDKRSGKQEQGYRTSLQRDILNQA